MPPLPHISDHKNKTAQDRESAAAENSVWTMMMAVLIPQVPRFFKAEVAINHHKGDGDDTLQQQHIRRA